MTKPEEPRSTGPKGPRQSSNKAIPPRVKRDPVKGWTLVPPHCAFELEPDLEDAEMLLKEGDVESARDAALYLLEECQDMTAAHELLGRIAERELKDANVAQGHYGYVFELTLKWLGHLDMTPMDKSRKINKISLAAAEGLKRVLENRKETQKAAQVARHIAAWKGESTSPSQFAAGRPASGPKGGRPWSGPKKRRPMTPRPQQDKPQGP